MIAVTSKVLSPDEIILATKTADSGCVSTYVGLIRDNSRGKKVEYVEYTNRGDESVKILESIAEDVKKKFSINKMSLVHRAGKLNVGDINLVVAVAASHRGEAISACSFAIDEFKARLPTDKIEKYTDGTVSTAF
jgi:molybdopterin synthase catalytic subunit